MHIITSDQLEQKIQCADRFELVEVLGPDEYERFHLPGAINIPLDDDFEGKVEHTLLDKKQPVVVYCKDERCDASPRAARRLEQMGFETVLDFSAGKEGWKNAGLSGYRSRHV